MKRFRRPKKHDLLHRKNTRFVRVDPRTWVESSFDMSDEDAIKVFKQHQQKVNESIKNPPKQDTNFFR